VELLGVVERRASRILIAVAAIAQADVRMVSAIVFN